MVDRAKRIQEVDARTSGVQQRRDRRVSVDPRAEPDEPSVSSLDPRVLAPTVRPPPGAAPDADGPPTGLTPRPVPSSGGDVHAYLVALAVAAGADDARARAAMANAATAWNLERMERDALVDAYLRHDVAAVLRLVQLLAEDVESRDDT